MALEAFSPAVREWFVSSFPAPTPAQEKGWPAIASGEHTLILAPTGSGKTLAAFLWGLDRLSSPSPSPSSEPAGGGTGTRLLYLSPLRALAFDVERNLRAPLQGIELAAERLGSPITVPTVAMRTGDTSARDRAALARRPPDVLITTPESLYLMLTSQARSTLVDVQWVIIDEIHAMAGTKRGAHLAVSLERLEAIANKPPQRIGLSATQRPLEEIARFLGGRGNDGAIRRVTIVDAGIAKPLEVEVVVPVEDMARLGEVLDDPLDPLAGPGGAVSAGPPRASIWPAVHPRLLELIQAHHSTLVFVNARRLAERLAARLNDLAEEELVKAHHGSLAREQRLQIESELKAGTLRALVATSSLELGIDMGAVDLVVQVESPGSVASGLQRIGRAGHQVGEPSRGKVFPKFRGDLLEAAVVVDRMGKGLIEET
ncbi:MAG TPA: DEAD/DEAH box helicase, partial [Acidimicrobiia bacterium]|nr:DEAD/DEAH box helicase [Acidimicrobiia bacterium]